MRTRFFILFTVYLVFSFHCFDNINALENQSRPKIAIVLSGGGAKGMAHIGALKIINKIGLPIDYIVGTSMGAIIGGLTAIGYNPEQIDSIVKSQDWPYLLSDKIPRRDQNLDERENSEKYVISMPFNRKKDGSSRGGLIKARNVTNLLSNLTVGYHDSTNFDKLPLSFACVSCNIVTGKQVVIKSGMLPQAMRASMAIPGVFTPVRIGKMVLVDGGVINNYPVNVAKDLGADIIIGVDVQGDLHKSDELNSTGNILGQLVSLLGQNVYLKNIKQTNIYIKVNVEGYSAASFIPSAIETLIKRGEIAAEKQIAAMYKLKDSLGYSKNYMTPGIKPYPYTQDSKIFINNITFQGQGIRNVYWILKKCNIKENSYISIREIEKVSNFLCANMGYSSVTYSIPKEKGNEYNLIFRITKRHENMLNFGIRFDSEEIASLLLNVTTNFDTKIPTSLSFTGRLSKRYEAKLRYTLEPFALRRLNMSYMFQYNNIDYFNIGKKYFNSIFRYHEADINYSNIWINNIKFIVGLKYEYYDYDKFLYPSNNRTYTATNEHFFTYYSQIYYNNMNRAFFPSEGYSLKFKYSLYTDNLIRYDNERPFGAFEFLIQNILPVTNRFKILPLLAGRFLIGDNFPFPKLNVMGSVIPGRYFDRELPFIGINNIEIMNNSLLMGGMRFRERLGKRHYISLLTNYALSSNNINNIFNEETRFGCGISYGISTIFGPLEAYLNYQNKADKFTFYINLGYYF